MDPVREDLKDLRRDLKEGMEGLQGLMRAFGDKLSAHALEDADREGRVASELGVMRSKLDSLTTVSEDRQRFMRGWLAGIIAVAVAAGVGFLFRSALENQSRSTPAPSGIVKP